MSNRHYRFIIEGLNFKFSDQSTTLIGFYTTLFIEASTFEEAESKVALLMRSRLLKNKITRNDSFLSKSFLGISESYEVDKSAEVNEGFSFFDMSVKDGIVSTSKSILVSLGIIKNSINLDI